MASRTLKAKLKNGGAAKLATGGAAKLKLARGGKASREPKEGDHEHDYNAKGSPELEKVHEKTGGFKGGGTAHGHHKGKKRLDKKARGGAAGHNPYSSAREQHGPDKDMAGKGHSGEMPGEVD